MIGTRTPFRFSFVGGGSDVATFYNERPGKVVSVAVSKYMYIFLHPYFEDKYLIKYSKSELVEKVADIQHPIVRTAVSRFDLGGLDINSIADIPAGTGLGSSSSFTVGLLHALYAQAGIMASKELLAREACKIEIEELKEPIGKQDQYAAAYGGLNKITFMPTGLVDVEPIPLTAQRLRDFHSSLLVFYTGQTRNARSVLADQNKNVASEGDKRALLGEMVDMVDPFVDGLVAGNFAECGALLRAGWERKRQLSKLVSTGLIDDYYNTAIANGAYGGKLLGAGGGGFLLFIAPPDTHSRIVAALNGIKKLDFSFDYTGSKIIHVGEM